MSVLPGHGKVLALSVGSGTRDRNATGQLRIRQGMTSYPIEIDPILDTREINAWPGNRLAIVLQPESAANARAMHATRAIRSRIS